MAARGRSRGRREFRVSKSGVAEAPAHPLSGGFGGVRARFEFTACDFASDRIAPAITGGGLTGEPVGEFLVVVEHVLILMSGPNLSGCNFLKPYVLLALNRHKG